MKISAAELRARASPTGPRRSDVKLEIRGQDSDAGGSMCGDNDPEDLTVVNPGMTPHRYMHDVMTSSPGKKIIHYFYGKSFNLLSISGM